MISKLSVFHAPYGETLPRQSSKSRMLNLKSTKSSSATAANTSSELADKQRKLIKR